MKKIIIGLVGEAASGKGTVAKYLVDKYGAQTLAFSASMKDCVRRLHLPLTRENIMKFSEITRHAYGEDLYSKVMAEDCRGLDADTIIVDGVRRPADVANLRQLPNFHLLYVTAPVELRWQRARGRGEKVGESEMTLGQFKAEDQFPTEVTIKEIGVEAEFTINNVAGIENLYASAESIIEYIKADDFDHPHPHRNQLKPVK